MDINVLDSAAAMQEIFAAPLDRRPDLLRALYRPVTGMFSYFGPDPDVIGIHQVGSGFAVDRDDERHVEGLRALRDADAWTRIEAALGAGLELQLSATPDIRVPERLRVLLVLGEPTDEHFMDVNLGMSANGAFTGYLWINLWPSDENLARIEATAVHELNHNLRYTNLMWDVATVTVGEQIVSEGLADAFARQMYGDLGYTRIGAAARGDDAVFAKVVANLGITGMQNFPAWVHGDAAAVRFGGTPVGLPTGSGYAVGNRLLDTYLASTGQSAADALLVNRDDVIAVAAAVGAAT